MEWIKLNIHTNLDVCEFWPSSLPVCPRVGEYVLSDGGLKLLVCRVTHSYRCVDIELTTGPEWQSIKQFNEWYTTKGHLK